MSASVPSSPLRVDTVPGIAASHMVVLRNVIYASHEVMNAVVMMLQGWWFVSVKPVTMVSRETLVSGSFVFGQEV